ncbi:MAG: dihydroorotase [Proteobacteria bacterium]|nr:dihydroorotase [Pseudomonadota bacterium]
MSPRLADLSIKKTRPGRVAYHNARLLDPETGLDVRGGLLTEGEFIFDLGPHVTGEGLAEDYTVVDAEGLCLAPGLVDMRAHLREPGYEHKETIHTGSRSAAAGGIATIACMPSTNPTIDDVSLVHFIERRARETSLVKVHPIAAVTKERKGEQLTELGLLSDAGAVAFSDGLNPIANANVLRRALSYGTIFDVLLIQHPEDIALSGSGVMNSSELSTRLGLPGIPAESEALMAARDIRIAEMVGGRLHIAHVTTAETIELVRRAKIRGLKITCDTAPQYFALNENAVGDYLTFAKVRPPLRSESDRQAVVAGLKDGTIDAVVSDHAPHDQDSKRQPFVQAAFGIVGLETMLPLLLETVHNRHLSLLEALATVTFRPADLLKLRAGRLQKGFPADLVLFDPDLAWRIDRKAFQSKSKNSPFDERPVMGRALRTVVSGRTVMAFSDED